MIDRAYVQRMARYNRWQNENLYGVADRLSEDERRRERGAFFGSIHKTLNHLLWGDLSWMSRFTGMPKPQGGTKESVALYPGWEDLKSARVDFDRTFIAWADTIDPAWLAADQTFFSNATQREWTHPRWLLVTHLINHQTHHRGQVHCMLTQAGGKPSDTDLPFMPD
ncbi:MAG: DinB family protein [Xanthobacteraceae bacterium]